MNQNAQKDWKDEVLAHVLKAVVSDASIRETLIFKGARILNLHLTTNRQSLDIDTNLTMEFQQRHPDRAEQASWFETRIAEALHAYFEDQNPVRYTVESVKVLNRPAQRPHAFGWDGLVAELKINDQRFQGIRGLPKLEIEIAAPEKLGRNAVCDLPLDGIEIRAYTLSRIAGEKLRAFLTSLPTYRTKFGGSERVARAKDLFDLARILDSTPLDDTPFWDEVALEFGLACESRYVDCSGLQSFQEDWEQTEQTYKSDGNLAAVEWEDAASALASIVGFLEGAEIFPVNNPVP